MPNLESLNLSHNYNLLNPQVQLKKLHTLDIEQCTSLTNMSNFICPELQYLNASCVPLAPDYITNYPKLEILHIELETEHMELLKSLPLLTELNFRGPKDEDVVLEYIESHGKQLKALSVGRYYSNSLYVAFQSKI